MAASLGAAPILVSPSELNTSIQIEIAKSFPGFDANIVHGSEGYAAAILKKPITNADRARNKSCSISEGHGCPFLSVGVILEELEILSTPSHRLGYSHEESVDSAISRWFYILLLWF